MLTRRHIEASQAARFLRWSYEFLRSGRHGSACALKMGRRLGLDEQQSKAICSYLAEQGLIGRIGPHSRFFLSSKGLDQIEWALANPGFLHDLIGEESEAPTPKGGKP